MKLFKVCAVFFLFAGCIELFSWVYRSTMPFSFKLPDYAINEWNQLGKDFETFPARHPNILVPADDRDYPLIFEAGDYHVKGEKTGIYLLNKGRLLPNLDDDYSVVGKFSRRLKFKTRFRTDDIGRRSTSFQSTGKLSNNLFFIGCSMTQGDGVDEDFIFPSLIAKDYRKSKIMNMGIGGTSPSHTLQMISRGDDYFFRGVDKTVPTYFIYTFIDDHFERIFATSNYLQRNPQGINNPNYTLENEKIKYSGTFDEDFLSLRWFYKFFGMSNFARVTKVRLPFIKGSHYEIMTMIFSEMKTQLKKEYPDMREFVLVIYPGNKMHIKEWKPYLDREKIRYLDYSEINISRLLQKHYTLPGDIHPSADAHAFYAELLKRDLQSLIQ